MAGVTHIEIKESVEELEALVRQQKNARFKERGSAIAVSLQLGKQYI